MGEDHVSFNGKVESGYLNKTFSLIETWPHMTSYTRKLEGSVDC